LTLRSKSSIGVCNIFAGEVEGIDTWTVGVVASVLLEREGRHSSDFLEE
jgi:hypothetical protein